jgi:UDPglucose--hexose-1-phosphate uridylyltransferase
VSSKDQSHSRRNLLTGEWVLVSPQRLVRPWQGQVETPEPPGSPAHDPDCYLCPGNTRASGDVNPDYRGPFVFDNDFPALTPHSEPGNAAAPPFELRPEPGECRVFCYTERHDQRLSTMPVADVETAIHSLNDQFESLDRRDEIDYVQIFENRGRMMGCSNLHPHAQIWATKHLPTEIEKELGEQRSWFDNQGTPLLVDYCAAELKDGARIVTSNEYFVAIVPYWATWPFETMLLPRRTFGAPTDMTADELSSFARILSSVLSATDHLFDTAAPYSMGFHPRPSDGEPHPEWVFHTHIYPPLLRSASIRKHMVGYEMLAMPQRDMTPEQAAEMLRDVCSNDQAAI